MRRLGFVVALLVAAFAAPVRAGNADEPIDPDEVAEPRLPSVQLVQAWPKTKQALLYDPIQGTYVVVAAGQNVDGFRVSRIGKNQIVLSTIGGAARDYVLLPTPVADLPDAPGTAPSAPKGPDAPPAPTSPPVPARPDLLDPYPSGMLDPYGSEGVRIVAAPPQSAAQPGQPTPSTPPATTAPSVTTAPPSPATAHPTPVPATVPAAPPKAPPTTAPAPKAPTPTVAKAPAVHIERGPATPEPRSPSTKTPDARAPTPAAAANPGVVVLNKAELDAALGDFGTLVKDSRLTLGPTGVAFAHVAPASLFARVGLRDGDRVVSINGQPIRSIDDAANLYAQLAGLKQLSIDVVRGSGHVTLHADLR